MRSETKIVIAEMDKQLQERKYFSTQEIVEKFSVSVKVLNNVRIREYKAKNNIIHLYSGIHCRDEDSDYVSSLHPDRQYKPQLSDNEIVDKILQIKKEFMVSGLKTLLGEKNKGRILPILSDLLDRGLVTEVQSHYGRSTDLTRKLYYVTAFESDLIGGMSIQDPPTRSLDHYRQLLLGFKKLDSPFSVRELEEMGHAIGITGGCGNEIQRLMQGGYVMYNNDIRKYEFLK